MTAREFADKTGNRFQRWGDEDEVFAFAEAYAEAKLRAVSDALDDGEQFDDIRLARIRAIAGGKDRGTDWETHAGNHVDRIRKLEAKLRAISEILEAKLEAQGSGKYAPYDRAEIDAWRARIRAIVEGRSDERIPGGNI